MLKVAREEIICDFAEYYQIYDIYSYKASYIAILAKGLRDGSRTQLKLANTKLNLNKYLLMGIFDMLKILVWQKTKDGQEGRNQPSSLLEIFLNEKNEKVEEGFDTIEEFKQARDKILRKGVE